MRIMCQVQNSFIRLHYLRIYGIKELMTIREVKSELAVVNLKKTNSKMEVSQREVL